MSHWDRMGRHFVAGILISAVAFPLTPWLHKLNNDWVSFAAIIIAMLFWIWFVWGHDKKFLGRSKKSTLDSHDTRA